MWIIADYTDMKQHVNLTATLGRSHNWDFRVTGFTVGDAVSQRLDVCVYLRDDLGRYRYSQHASQLSVPEPIMFT